LGGSYLTPSKVVETTENQLLKYLNNEVNAVEANVIIGREKVQDNREYVVVTPKESDQPLYAFWNTRKGKRKGKPKHTGGKPSYVKLYLGELDKHSSLSLEATGACVRLARYIEWHTGYLITGKGQRKRYMGRDDIAKSLGVSLSTAKRTISCLKRAGVLDHDKTGYKMVGLILKGGAAYAD
jgi:hypothetical protein